MKTARLITASLATCFLSFFTVTTAQGILSNTGFETYSTCPTGIAQLTNVAPFNNISGHGGTADYMNACGLPIVGVPNNVFGNQNAHNGNGYIGLTLYYATSPNFREYVCTPFTTPMVPGITYRIEFYASLADNVQNSTDALQFYLSNGCPTWGGGWGPMTTYTPQAALPSNTFINDKSNWVYYSVDVVATSAWTNITMGNFLDDASTNVIFVSAAPYTSSYIYVDDFDVIPLGVMDADMAGPFVSENENVELSWSTTREENTRNWVVQRSVGDASHFEDLGTLDAAGHSSDRKEYKYADIMAVRQKQNFYRIKLIDQDGKVTYSETVSITPGKGEEWFVLGGPNPVNEGTSLNAAVTCAQTSDINAQVVDLSGRVISEQSFVGSAGQNEISISTEGLNSGYYLLVVANGSRRESRRIIVMDGGI